MTLTKTKTGTCAKTNTGIMILLVVLEKGDFMGPSEPRDTVGCLRAWSFNFFVLLKKNFNPRKILKRCKKYNPI